jgi:hypothetical protein
MSVQGRGGCAGGRIKSVEELKEWLRGMANNQTFNNDGFIVTMSLLEEP